MSLFSGNHFYWSNVSEQKVDITGEIRRFIDNANGNAIAVIQEKDELTLDMIFNEPRHVAGTEDIEMTCIYARHELDKIGKTFIAPYENLTSYRNAMQDREFFELGDIAVGLEASRGYHVTSKDAFFIGKIMPEDDYESQSNVATRRWGDIYCTLGVIHSTEGEPGETHRVEMNHFIPTHDPSKEFGDAGKLYSHVGISDEVPGLIQGLIYPIEDMTLNAGNTLEVRLTGAEQSIPFDFGGMRLFKKGELL